MCYIYYYIYDRQESVYTCLHRTAASYVNYENSELSPRYNRDGGAAVRGYSQLLRTIEETQTLLKSNRYERG